MPGNNFINIKINIKNESICLTQDENPAAWPFTTDENDNSSNNIRIELGIAKVFHKVLNLIKAQSDLFQKEDFELLGEMLAKILFGKSNSPDETRNYFMKVIEQSLDITNPAANKICRIFLEFDEKSGVAMLPWEYTLYKTRSTKDSKAIYLSANVKSRFQLIRRVKDNSLSFPGTDRLFIIVLLNLEGNPDTEPGIDSRIDKLPQIKTAFKNLQDKFHDTLVVGFIESTPFDEIKQEIEDLYAKWSNQYGQSPSFVLHYIGHSILENEIGKVAIKDKVTGKPRWLEDKTFASLFSENSLEGKQPSLVCLQACDSAKIGSHKGELRGVAYEFTSIDIPAVVGMQNEIDTPYSNAFFERFYDGILNGMDVAEAVTAGRDYLGRKFNVIGDGYVNNSFGSPVLFITTEDPIRIMRPGEEPAGSIEAVQQAPAGSSRQFAKSERIEERQRESEVAGQPRTPSMSYKDSSSPSQI